MPSLSVDPLPRPPFASLASAKMTNRYVRRLTAEPGKACFVCSRPSTVVLVSTTAGAGDFFYICSGHLSDRNFATLLLPQQAASGAESAVRIPHKVSKEEVQKVKEEYESRQRAKKEAAEAKERRNAAPSGDDKKAESQGWLSCLASSLKDVTSSTTYNASFPKNHASPRDASQASPSQGGTYEYYSLHRSFYLMRLNGQKKRAALCKAKEMGFPSVPRG